MKDTKLQLVRQVKEALKACLARILSVSIDSIKRLADTEAGENDLLLRLRLPSGICEVVVVVRSSGQPRTVREATDSLLRLTRDRRAVYGVVAVPFISPTSAEICEDANMGFVDFAGNYRLRLGDVFIERLGAAKSVTARREHKSLFTLKASRILRVLFKSPRKKWRLLHLAREAETSLGQVYNVKELLLDQELVDADEKGISLTDPDALLSMWAEAAASRKRWVDYFTLTSPSEIEADIATLCDKEKIPYALMGFSAAARYAPSVTSKRAMAYVSADEHEIARKLGLKEVASGANVTLASPPDDGVYYDSQEIDGMRVVSPLQAYLDLAHVRGLARRYGRGDEAAQMILESKVRPAW
jgi:hypothetical protein